MISIHCTKQNYIALARLYPTCQPSNLITLINMKNRTICMPKVGFEFHYNSTNILHFVTIENIHFFLWYFRIKEDKSTLYNSHTYRHNAFRSLNLVMKPSFHILYINHNRFFPMFNCRYNSIKPYFPSIFPNKINVSLIKFKKTFFIVYSI
jgi:hypothetical protein